MAILLDARQDDGTPLSLTQGRAIARRVGCPETGGDGCFAVYADRQGQTRVSYAMPDRVADQVQDAFNRAAAAGGYDARFQAVVRPDTTKRMRRDLPRDVHERYVLGGCFEFATALHDLTSLPIETLVDPADNVDLHAFVAVDHEHGLDVRGIMPKWEIALEHGRARPRFRTLSEQEAVNPGDASEPAIIAATEDARTTIADVQHLLPEPNGAHDTVLAESGFWGERGAGVLLRAQDTGRIMLLERAFCEEAGTWGLPGGAVDPGETYLDAALRELDEEAGLTGVGPEAVTRLYRFRDPTTSFRYQNFLVDLPRQVELPELGESTDYGWFDPDDLPSPLHFGVCALRDHQPSWDLVRNVSHDTEATPAIDATP